MVRMFIVSVACLLASFQARLSVHEGDLPHRSQLNQQPQKLKAFASFLYAHVNPAVGIRLIRTNRHHRGHHHLHPSWEQRVFSRTRDVQGNDILSTNDDADVVLPVGALCPFRSAGTSEVSPVTQGMDDLQAQMPDLMTDLQRFGLEVQTGGMPEPAQSISLGRKLLNSLDKWDSVISGMRSSDDFQTQEYYWIIMAFLKRKNESIDNMSKLMRWQAESMIAFGSGMPPPMPPSNVDLAQLEQKAQASPMSLWNPVVISAPPFKKDALESEVVQKELVNLASDHANLVSLGEKYGSFDSDGKLAFIDALENVEDRWDVFYTRFKWMGAFNSEFVQQTSVVLKSMGLSPAVYRDILREAHQLMREVVEEQRYLR